METKNLVGMLAGYYLSRFDAVAYARFSGNSQAGVHGHLAERIGVPASSVKLWRDEFDPIHSNSRRGWHRRKMAPSRLRMAEQLSTVSEVGVYRLLTDCLNAPDFDVIRKLQPAEDEFDEREQVLLTRAMTGALAESHFIKWFENGESFFTGPLQDCRLLQCGYDFQAMHAGVPAYVEVKGLRQNVGGVLMTDKEWMTSTQLGELYFIVLIRSVELSLPAIEVFRNPAATLSPNQNVTTVIQVSWTIPKLDPSQAVWASPT